MKIRLLHAPARHIVCAYSLPGKPEESHHLKDSCDDDENGAGSTLLRAMTESEIDCKAFFIVRYCGEAKLGADRLGMYVKAAERLLKQKPKNKILDKNQCFIERQVDTVKKYRYTDSQHPTQDKMRGGHSGRGPRKRD